MARPPVFPAEEKVRIVLPILACEITVAWPHGGRSRRLWRDRRGR
jgi:hypothetical protein